MGSSVITTKVEGSGDGSGDVLTVVSPGVGSVVMASSSSIEDGPSVGSLVVSSISSSSSSSVTILLVLGEGLTDGISVTMTPSDAVGKNV